jgi:hypothetical protein
MPETNGTDLFVNYDVLEARLQLTPDFIISYNPDTGDVSGDLVEIVDAVVRSLAVEINGDVYVAD